MNYASILKCDIANGNGFRVSLFVSGCGRGCEGCFNKEAQNPNYGQKFDSQAKGKIFKELEQEYCQGLSLLGGDPMSMLSDNREVVLALCKEIKEKFPHKTIWMWSGYTLDELKEDITTREVLKYIDVLIDGPFKIECHNPALKFRGSSNQRILKLHPEVMDISTEI